MKRSTEIDALKDYGVKKDGYSEGHLIQKARKHAKKYLKSPSESAIIHLQRVVFLRKSSCRNAARFLRKWGKVYKQIV